MLFQEMVLCVWDTDSETDVKTVIRSSIQTASEPLHSTVLMKVRQSL